MISGGTSSPAQIKPRLGETLQKIFDCWPIKHFQTLEDGARERLALNAYLTQLEQPQVAFGVKQRTPDTLTATLELE